MYILHSTVTKLFNTLGKVGTFSHSCDTINTWFHDNTLNWLGFHFEVYIVTSAPFALSSISHWDLKYLVFLRGTASRRILGCREQPPLGAPWVSGLVGHFVQTWPDSECSHTVQCLDCKDLN